MWAGLLVSAVRVAAGKGPQFLLTAWISCKVLDVACNRRTGRSNILNILLHQFNDKSLLVDVHHQYKSHILYVQTHGSKMFWLLPMVVVSHRKRDDPGLLPEMQVLLQQLRAPTRFH